MSDYRKAWDSATKEGDRHMRCYGRTEWNKDDLSAAGRELDIRWGKIYKSLGGQMKGLGQSIVDETG